METTTRTGYCSFCSTLGDLHQLASDDGIVWWACRSTIQGETCFDLWQRMLTRPPKFTVGDF